MITRQRTVDPFDLLVADGGPVVAAQRITGDVLREVIDAGATAANGLAPRASWVAIIPEGAHTGPVKGVDWDPTTAIPPGTYRLRCTGYSVSTTPERVR